MIGNRVRAWSLLLLLSAATSFAEDVDAGRRSGLVEVRAYASDGKLLRKGLGFLWDEATVICSLSGVKGASIVEVDADGTLNNTNKLMSYNAAFDLAIMKTDAEFEEIPALGSSNLVAAGDKIYFYARQQNRWLRVDAAVKDWIDSGQGYQMMRLSVPSNKVAEPSPLCNQEGKVIGWINRAAAIPLEAIGALVSENNVALSLEAFKQQSDPWIPRKRIMKASFPKWKKPDLIEKNGSSRFPYTFLIPTGWKPQELGLGNRYLCRASNEAFGIQIELRIFPSEGEDMFGSIENAEARVFTGMNRASLLPFSAQGFTGFVASYDDLEAAYITSVFYTMFKGNIYALSVSFPQRLAEEIEPMANEILGSLKP